MRLRGVSIGSFFQGLLLVFTFTVVSVTSTIFVGGFFYGLSISLMAIVKSIPIAVGTFPAVDFI